MSAMFNAATSCRQDSDGPVVARGRSARRSTPLLKDLRFDYILANPPFNVSNWGGERLREDARWVYGAPPVGNANYAWLQHILWHLAPNGTAGVVLANGSMSSTQSGENAIRKAMIEADVVDCMVALPGHTLLFDADSRLPLVPTRNAESEAPTVGEGDPEVESDGCEGADRKIAEHLS